MGPILWPLSYLYYIKKHSNVSFSFFVGFIEIGHLVLVSIIRVRVLTFETGPRKKIMYNFNDEVRVSVRVLEIRNGFMILGFGY
ncbi:hypothetical protein RIR_jg1054.t1 [Rhizophagus irregularis DAOM 181602=DAOM 197198]|nr:hypothetical protein RIR_jg1054.t1 [Rhizophagus irregularis DAOM 181602=DAOM 197198]